MNPVGINSSTSATNETGCLDHAINQKITITSVNNTDFNIETKTNETTKKPDTFTFDLNSRLEKCMEDQCAILNTCRAYLSHESSAIDTVNTHLIAINRVELGLKIKNAAALDAAEVMLQEQIKNGEYTQKELWEKDELNINSEIRIFKSQKRACELSKQIVDNIFSAQKTISAEHAQSIYKNMSQITSLFVLSLNKSKMFHAVIRKELFSYLFYFVDHEIKNMVIEKYNSLPNKIEKKTLTTLFESNSSDIRNHIITYLRLNEGTASNEGNALNNTDKIHSIESCFMSNCDFSLIKQFDVTVHDLIMLDVRNCISDHLFYFNKSVCQYKDSNMNLIDEPKIKEIVSKNLSLFIPLFFKHK